MSCMELRLPPGGLGFSPYKPGAAFRDIPNIGMWFMADACLEWLTGHSVYDRVQINWDITGEEWIVILPEDLALMFKLTWGGQ